MTRSGISSTRCSAARPARTSAAAIRQGLSALARQAWDEAKKHKAGDIQIALLPGNDIQDPESVLVAINDDRPFLFDSALAAAIAAGARIRAAFHPILDIDGQAHQRDRAGAGCGLGEPRRRALIDNLQRELRAGPRRGARLEGDAGAA